MQDTTVITQDPVIRPAIGPVVNGDKMRIDDLEQINDELPFDVIDDITVFMRNDPMFYRKEFFPLVMQMKGLKESDKPINSKLFMPMIKKATEQYCKKFNIPKRPEDLLDADEQRSLIQKIYAEEMTNIKKGAY